MSNFPSIPIPSLGENTYGCKNSVNIVSSICIEIFMSYKLPSKHLKAGHYWSDSKMTFKVTAHTWAIFFPKNRIFSFFDIL